MSRYRGLPPTTREEVAEALKGNCFELICARFLGAVVHGEEPQGLTTTCIELLEHPSTEVRRAAVVALGHVARIHRNIDRESVIPRLALLADDAQLSGAAADALDDIATFAPRRP